MGDKTYILHQCRLERPNGLHTLIQTAWLPHKFCKVDSLVTFKSEDHKNVWTVSEVFQGEMSSDDILEARDEYRHHRKRTDKTRTNGTWT